MTEELTIYIVTACWGDDGTSIAACGFTPEQREEQLNAWLKRWWREFNLPEPADGDYVSAYTEFDEEYGGPVWLEWHNVSPSRMKALS